MICITKSYNAIVLNRHISFYFLFPLFFVAILFLGTAIPIAIADNTIIDLNIELRNIAIDNEKPSSSLGEGLAFRIGQMGVSTGDMTITDKNFPNKDAQKKYYNIKGQIISGRSVTVDYKLTNYEFNENSRIKTCKCNKEEQDIPEQVECNCFRLFSIAWPRYRFDYAIKSEEGKWQEAFILPSNFYFDTPRPATVVGIGDIKLSIPGLRISAKPNFNLRNLDQIYRRDTYKIVVSRHAVLKQFILIPEDIDIPKLTITDSKFEIIGKANIGESAITTRRSPFWYPFDAYSFKFKTITYFDSYLNINFTDIEDLNLEVKEALKVKSKKDEIKPFNIALLRKHKFRNHILPVLLAISPLLSLFRKEILWLRYLTYFTSIGGIYLSLPEPLNVPKINMFTICLSLILLMLYGLFEREMFKRILRLIISKCSCKEQNIVSKDAQQQL